MSTIDASVAKLLRTICTTTERILARAESYETTAWSPAAIRDQFSEDSLVVALLDLFEKTERERDEARAALDSQAARGGERIERWSTADTFRWSLTSTSRRRMADDFNALADRCERAEADAAKARIDLSTAVAMGEVRIAAPTPRPAEGADDTLLVREAGSGHVLATIPNPVPPAPALEAEIEKAWQATSADLKTWVIRKAVWTHGYETGRASAASRTEGASIAAAVAEIEALRGKADKEAQNDQARGLSASASRYRMSRDAYDDALSILRRHTGASGGKVVENADTIALLEGWTLNTHSAEYRSGWRGALRELRRHVATTEPQRRPIDGKFHIEGSQIIKTASGEVVPEDEPLFLLRGRDRLALATLRHYRHLCALEGCNNFQVVGLEGMLARFNQYAADHPTKQPGVTRGAPWVPGVNDAPSPQGEVIARGYVLRAADGNYPLSGPTFTKNLPLSFSDNFRTYNPVPVTIHRAEKKA